MKCDEGMLDILFNSGLALDGFIEFLEGASLACLIVFHDQWTSPLLLLDRHIFEHCQACTCISAGINYIESFKENTNEKQMKDGRCGHELIAPARQLCLVLRAQMQGSEATHTLAYNDSTHSKTLSVGSLLLVV